MLKQILLIIINTWIVISIIQASPARAEVLIHFRFYEGIKNTSPSQPSIATTYSFKPLPSNSIQFATDEIDEQSRLKRVYNLSRVKLLAFSEWTFASDEVTSRIQKLIIDGHEIEVSFSPRPITDTFHLEVLQRNISQSLLETELILPEANTAIYGFEDSNSKIYFLSIDREAVTLKTPGKKSSNEKPIELSPEQIPDFVNWTEPEFPEQAIKDRIEGVVIIKVIVNKTGQVTSAEITNEPPAVFKETALRTVKKWQYKPFIVDGQPVTVTFSIALDYYFY